MRRVTPVQIELIRNAFNAAAGEMSVALYRGAHTAIIYEAKDCSVGLYDAQARLLGQAPGLPIFLGSLEACIRIVTERIGLAGYRDGDVFMLNDSYLQGSHLMDITVFAPVFFGGVLIGFAATRADGGHIGGKDLGVSSDTTHIYEEGMRIPPVRLVKEGTLDEELLDIVALNSWFHEARRGDLAAQISACHKGRERLIALYERHGSELISAAKEDIFRQSRELDAAAVADMTDGVYSAEGWIDNDGVDPEPVAVKVRVTIDGEQMAVDLSGSADATRGPINSGRPQAVSACRLAFKQLINPSEPVTGGSFQNLEVHVPDGSLFDAHEPAPCQWYYTPLGLLIDLIQQALAPALPDAVAAAHFGDSMIVSFAATDGPEGEGFAYIVAELGGWGGFSENDGQHCMINVINGDFQTLPVEFVEDRFPITILEWSIRQDSGGPGRYRGGAGARKVFRVDRDDTIFSCWLDRTVTPAWGVLGGEAAPGGRAVLNEGGPGERTYNKLSNLRLRAGDTVTLYTGGGGGYGPVAERDPGRVRQDLASGYISAAQARQVYGLTAAVL